MQLVRDLRTFSLPPAKGNQQKGLCREIRGGTGSGVAPELHRAGGSSLEEDRSLQIWRSCAKVPGIRQVWTFPLLGVGQLGLAPGIRHFCFLTLYFKVLCRIAQLGLAALSSGSTAA